MLGRLCGYLARLVVSLVCRCSMYDNPFVPNERAVDHAQHPDDIS